VRDLYQVAAPEGYHIATKEELDGIIQNYQRLNKKISFPIYAEFRKDGSLRTQYYTVKRYDNKGRLERTFNMDRYYDELVLNCIFIENPVSISNKHFSYTDDIGFSSTYATWDSDGYKASGLYNMTTYPTITSGYVYVIKDKEENK
ncbi:MAG: hypothetical protein J1F25_05920, partial [Prevotellaceae bacterium]|nr:hypothetical protein [Prevotellaceae bacterium]